MSHSATNSGPNHIQAAFGGLSATRGSNAQFVSIDLIVAILFIAAFAIVTYSFQYHHALAESDLYRVLVGLLDGEVSGRGLASDMHYDREFGFGYLEFFYVFFNPETLRDPDRLMAVINAIGLWVLVPGLLLFWAAVRLIHGARPATIALIVFALGPMIPEMATSGHQTIPMFTFFCAGAVLLFLPLTGWRAVLAEIGGAVCLLLGFTMRGELFLGLPWLVLARTDFTSVRTIILSGLRRAIAPGSALIGFILLQRYVGSFTDSALDTTVTTYLFESYTSLALVVPGFLYLSVGCGFVTVLATAVAVVYLGSRSMFGAGGAARPLIAQLAAPLVLILLPTLFFLPNPLPPRHFIFPLAGMSILIGIALVARPAVTRTMAFAAAFAIGIANQVLAEAARPPLMRFNEVHSPYLPVRSPYPVPTHANLGWEWRRHQALIERREKLQAFADSFLTTCDPRLIVLSDDVEQLFSRLYAGGTPVEAHRFVVAADTGSPPLNPSIRQSRDTILIGHGDTRLTGMIGKRGQNTFIILEKSHLWPADPVTTLLGMPAFADYKIVEDPNTMSTYDKTSVPPDRQPRWGCPVR
jgi:hypothetical protein